MTYKELIMTLRDLTPEQLEMDVSIWCSEVDEYYPMQYTSITEETDVLDKDHPIIVI